MDKQELYATTLGRDWKVKMSRIARTFFCPACKASAHVKCDTLFIAPGRATCDARIFAAADAEVARVTNAPPENAKRLSGWSDDNDKELWRMWEGGADIHQIADRLKRTPRAIIWRLSDHFAAITIEVRDSNGALRGVIVAPGADIKQDPGPAQDKEPVQCPDSNHQILMGADALTAADDFQRKLATMVPKKDVN